MAWTVRGGRFRGQSLEGDERPWPSRRTERILGGTDRRLKVAIAMWDEGLELLDESQCLDLLGRGTVGRVAVTVGALPAIFPVNFALSEDAVVFRTGEGTKLAAATDHAVVAFEVDDWDPMEHTGWSVLAVGKASVVDDPEEVARLRRLPLAPWARGSREHFVRMPIEFVSGRRIDHKAGGPVRP